MSPLEKNTYNIIPLQHNNNIHDTSYYSCAVYILVLVVKYTQGGASTGGVITNTQNTASYYYVTGLTAAQYTPSEKKCKQSTI